MNSVTLIEQEHEESVEGHNQYVFIMVIILLPLFQFFIVLMRKVN
jgi:hypothetical protein